MFGKYLILILASALFGTAASATAQDLEGGTKDTRRGGIESGRSETGGQSYGDRNRGGGWGFYSYPRSRSVDGRGARTLDRQPGLPIDEPAHRHDANYGSAYYGPDYGAPYNGGGYYDGGTYYRERRDR